jgi:hypothetical protein
MAERAQTLEIEAAEQRRRLHESVSELRGAVKSKLDVKSNAREYLIPASAIVAGIGLIIGYGLLGSFMPHRRRSAALDYTSE